MKKEPKKWNKNMHSVCDDYDIALEKTEEKEEEVEKKTRHTQANTCQSTTAHEFRLFIKIYLIIYI